MKRLWLALVVAIPVVAPQVRVRSQPSMATAFWDQMQAVNWGATYPAWRRGHPQVVCRSSPAADHAKTSPDDLWSHRCSQTRPSDEADWFFYALNSDERIAERLEQFRAVGTGLSLGQLEAVHRELSDRISTRYGPGREPGLVLEFGSAFWRHVRLWRSSDVEV